MEVVVHRRRFLSLLIHYLFLLKQIEEYLQTLKKNLNQNFAKLNDLKIWS